MNATAKFEENMNDLMKPLPSGAPAVSSYAEFRRITGEKDSPEMFSTWLLVAATLMLKPKGRG